MLTKVPIYPPAQEDDDWASVVVNRVLETQGCNVKFSELTKLPQALIPLNSNVMATLNEGGMEMVVFQKV